MNKYCNKLDLVSSGNLVEAMAILTSGAGEEKVKKKKKEKKPKEEAESLGETVEEEKPEIKENFPSKISSLNGEDKVTTHSMAAFQEIVKDFLSEMPTTKCENCEAYNSTIKKEGSIKLFKVIISPFLTLIQPILCVKI